MDYRNDIKEYIQTEIDVLNALDVDAINEVMNVLEETRLNGSTVYIFGNGGSSATASHYQNDFNKGISEHIEPKYNFQCLNDNVATLMAVANDIGFEEVFRFQLKGHLKPGDVIFAISGSGNSKNVLNAVVYAKEHGNKVIGVTGYDGGKLDEMCDYHMRADIDSMQITEDIHMIFDHLIMSIMYKQNKQQ
jgi:D-sedoheptulose 7-phosphate isomerase